MHRSVVPFLAVLILYCGISLSFGQSVSDEARRHFDRGIAAVEMAKSPDDYAAAVKELEEAARLAPDWPEVYYNLGLVREKAEKYGDAVKSLRQYLKLVPGSSDSEEVKSLINKLEYKAENVLTVDAIIDVLVSFSKGTQGWRPEGKCVRGSGELLLEREERDSVKVLAALRNEKRSFNFYYQTLEVTGPVLIYRTVVNVCGPDGLRDSKDKNSSCDAVIENEIEVVSRSLVRVNQEVLRGGFAYGLRTGDVFSCTFRKSDGGN